MESTLSGMDKVSNPVQPEKAFSPISRSELGNMSSDNLAQSRKARASIEVIFSENPTASNPEQSEKALSPTSTTEAGILTSVIYRHPLHNPSGIFISHISQCRRNSHFGQISLIGKQALCYAFCPFGNGNGRRGTHQPFKGISGFIYIDQTIG